MWLSVRHFSSRAGKIALVTGSTSGIGLGIAEQLVASGTCNKLMLHGFADEALVKRLTEKFSSSNVEVGYSGADLAKRENVEALISSTVSKFGGLDILVNNAGVQHVGPIDTFPDEKFEFIMNINSSAVWYACKYAVPVMKRNNWGRIVNISSVHGLVGSVEKTPYVMSKHAVIGLSKSLGLELAKTGITVNSVCPGWVYTPIVAAQATARSQALNVSEEEGKKSLLQEKQPSLQFVQPSAIGGAVVYLCSEAAKEVRGAALPVDGGWTAQ